MSFIQTHCANCWVIAYTPAHHLLPACCRGTVGLPVKPLMGRARVERACKPFFIFSYFIFFTHNCIYSMIIDHSRAGMQALLYIFIHIGPKSDHCLALSVTKSVSALFLTFVQVVKIDTWISLSSYTDLSKVIHGFFQVVRWICQNWDTYFSKLLHMDLPKLIRGYL